MSQGDLGAGWPHRRQELESVCSPIMTKMYQGGDDGAGRLRTSMHAVEQSWPDLACTYCHAYMQVLEGHAR